MTLALETSDLKLGQNYFLSTKFDKSIHVHSLHVIRYSETRGYGIPTDRLTMIFDPVTLQAI